MIMQHSIGRNSSVWPLAGLALLFGLAEAGLFFIRRYAMASAALGIETDMRRDLFAHLQRLPVNPGERLDLLGEGHGALDAIRERDRSMVGEQACASTGEAHERRVRELLGAEGCVVRAGDARASRQRDFVVEGGDAAAQARERGRERRVHVHDGAGVGVRPVNVAMDAPFG